MRQLNCMIVGVAALLLSTCSACAQQALAVEPARTQVASAIEVLPLPAPEASPAASAASVGPGPCLDSVSNILGMTAQWKNGLYLETAEKAFKIHVGGRAQIDAVWYNVGDRTQFGPDGVGQVSDGVNPRRCRFQIDGTFHEIVDFVAEYEFLGNTFNADPTLPANPRSITDAPGPTDVYATLTRLPVIGNFRTGNMKPPIGFEHLTSSRWLNFMERSFAFDTFIGGTNNGFLPGLMAFNWTEDERMTWALGVFKNNQTVFGWNVGDGEYDVSGRLTWLPVFEDDGRRLVHVGLGGSVRGLDDDAARLRARTLLRNGPFTLQTRLADIIVGGNNQALVVPEFALVHGPLTLQAEYFGTWIGDATFPPGRTNFGTYFTQSAYVECLYFLTGEHRRYLKHGGSGAAFDRVIPKKNFHPGEGCRPFSAGAWQIGTRFSWIDLDNQGLNPGTLYDGTVGLNWFLNPNMKFQWNYSMTYRNAPGGTADGYLHGFGMRFAMDF